MLRSLIGWLDDYLAGENPPTAARAVIGLLSFAAVLGSLLGSVAVKAGVFIAVSIVLASFVLVLLADRHALHRRVSEHQTFVSRYCDVIAQRLHSAPEVLSWRQVIAIDAKGNTRETVVIRAKTVEDQVHFYRLRSGPGWDQPAKYRRKVRVNVRSLSLEGEPGTRLQATSAWLPDGRLDLLIHFHSPVRSGTEIRLALDWTWPAKCLPLVRREPDVFTLDLTKTMTYGSLNIVLPAGHDAYFEPVGFHDNQEGFIIERSVNDDGQVEFTFEARQLAADHRAGVRLELRPRDAA